MLITITLEANLKGVTSERIERFEVDDDIASNYEKLTILSRKIASKTSINLIEIQRRHNYK